MNKPYHRMSPAERTAQRIEKNRAIDARVAAKKAELARLKERLNHRKSVSLLQEAIGLVNDIEILTGQTAEGQSLIRQLTMSLIRSIRRGYIA